MAHLSPKAAGAAMRRVVDLVAAGTLHRDAVAIVDCLLWRVRVPGRDRCQISLSALTARLHIQRARFLAIIADLEAVGVLLKQRQWVWVEWRGFRVKRQGPNIYVFPALTPEFSGRTAFREVRKKEARGKAAPTPFTPDMMAALVRLGSALGCSPGEAMPWLAGPRPG